MFSVSPEIYNALSLVSRWLFVFILLLLLFFSFSWLFSVRREQRERFKNLPGAGTVGEMVVISGSRDLPRDTWFPVPREGVLGSLRTCDLVIPCDGVRSHHLDFSWQDGTGLLIRPRTGCEVLIDGAPVTRRSAADSSPMIHGSFLQVGSAVLRLQLFTALSHTSLVFAPADAPESVENEPVPVPLPGQGFQDPGVFPAPPSGVCPPPPPSVPPFEPDPSAAASCPQEPAVVPVQDAQPGPAPAAPRRRRADRWKEDWSE